MIGITGVAAAMVRSTVVRFFCAGCLLAAPAVLMPTASLAANCSRSEGELRVTCISETAGDTVTAGSFEEGLPIPGDWVVVDVNDDDVDSFDVHAAQVDDGEAPDPLQWRIVGGLSDFKLTVEPPDVDIVVELAGDINDTTDGRNSATIANWNDADHEGAIEGINSGSILSTGDGPGAYGLRVSNRSENPNASAKAVNRGTIETRGTAARAMQAGIDGPGTATAINEGSVTTRGGSDGNYPAHAVITSAGSGGTATSINTSGATITTEGTGALGLRATIQEGSNGTGTAIATNETGATITTNGAGVVAVVEEEAGRALATNHGSILTTGDTTVDDAKPYGLYARIKSVPDVGGEARAFNSGTIETRGTGGRGVRAVVEGPGTAVAINEGSVTTGGDPTDKRYAAHGMDAKVEGDSGTARSVNSGTIETSGTGARGVQVSAGGAGTAEVINEGSVTTRGGPDGARRAYGLLASAGSTGTARAANQSGATLVTEGDGARGMQAIGGTAVATNDGQISTTGGFIATDTAVQSSDGLFAIGDAQATGVNTGSITTGNGPAAGLRVLHRGEEGAAAGENSGEIAASASGDAPLVGGIPHGPKGMEVVSRSADASATHGGQIEASGKAARGIRVVSEGTGAVEAVVDGGTVRAVSDTDIDADVAVGLWAETLGGTIEATIRNGARIEAPVAARFAGGPATVTVTGSTIEGSMRFDDFDDTLSVIDSTMNGDIDFGGGTDTLLIQSSIFNGRITGLGDLSKRGDGVARFNKDVTFAGSSATIEDGTLVFAGDFDLGLEGTMIVYDGARVTALLTDENKDDPPQITAGGGIVAQGAEGNLAELEIYLQADESVDDQTRNDSTTVQQMAQNVIAEGTPVTATGNAVAIKTERQDGEPETIGSIAVKEDGTRGDATVLPGAVLNPVGPDESDESSRRRQRAIVFGSGGLVFLAALLSSVDDLFEDGDSPDAKTAATDRRLSFTGASAHPAHGWRLTNSASADGHWTQALGGKAPMWTGATSTVGFDARIGRNLNINVSASPDGSMSLQRTDAASRLDGGLYAFHGRWRGETLFVGAGVSRGDWRARTTFANPVAGGGMASAFDMGQTHAQAGVGARFDLGALLVRPSVTLFSGQFERSAHTARGLAFRASVPDISQRYSGWKTGLRLSSSNWLGGTDRLRWRPAVNLGAMRTHSSTAAFTLQQSATNGALSFSSTAQADTLPRTVLAVGATADAIVSKKWRLRVGYAAMLVDGQPDHGVAAGVVIRF